MSEVMGLFKPVFVGLCWYSSGVVATEASGTEAFTAICNL